VPVREVSPGTLLLLALVTLARLPEPPTLLLIENPEQGIYPPLLAEVIASLRQMSQWSADRLATQVIVTTHSAAVRSLFGQHELTTLSRPDNRPDGRVCANQLRNIEQLP
jgi:predicted ATPase